MTESDWWACQGPQEMLEFLGESGKASERRCRLFWCACAADLVVVPRAGV